MTVQMKTCDLNQKRVLIREDFNVPIKNGHIESDARIKAALPTIRLALEKNARVILLSHLGRPKEGHYDAAFSLEPVAKRLAELLGQPVKLIKDFTHGIDVAPKEVVLLENSRFLIGEDKNDPVLAKQLASLCDVFIMDAFAVAHRAQASTVGVAQYANKACFGLLMEQELQALSQALEKPQTPVCAIVGGSKVSTKLDLLNNLLNKVDILVLGGGIANTFLLAQGHGIGKSLAEPDFVSQAQKLLEKAKAAHKQIWLPIDVVVSDKIDISSHPIIKELTQVSGDDLILDIGPDSQKNLTQLLSTAKTIIWNGPVGVFECAPFSLGTQKLAEAIASSHAYSLAGGGDTISAIEQFKVQDKINYISTGGGAFLEYVEGKVLPGVEVIINRG
jgi:phosphoglycerate kinase